MFIEMYFSGFGFRSHKSELERDISLPVFWKILYKTGSTYTVDTSLSSPFRPGVYLVGRF